jgi:hypothetical protein
MRKRFNPGHGRPRVPTVPVPVPVFAAAALLAAFSLGRKSGRMRHFGGSCHHMSRRFVGPRAAGCGPHGAKGPPTGEEIVRV